MIQQTKDGKFLLYYNGILMGEFNSWDEANSALEKYLQVVYLPNLTEMVKNDLIKRDF